MCTEVVRTRNPVLSLGRSFRGFMKRIGVLSSDSGGRSGVRTRLREQMNRLFCSAILLTYQEAGAEWRKGQLIADESHLWWDPQKPDALTLWESTVEINSKLFLEILAHPVPVDLRVLKAMKRSALGLDLYLWLAYKTFRMRRPIRLAWRQLYSQFGMRPDEVRDSQLNGFRSFVGARNHQAPDGVAGTRHPSGLRRTDNQPVRAARPTERNLHDSPIGGTPAAPRPRRESRNRPSRHPAGGHRSRRNNRPGAARQGPRQPPGPGGRRGAGRPTPVIHAGFPQVAVDLGGFARIKGVELDQWKVRIKGVD